MLPAPVERRFEKWAEKMPGASWPTWGGHVTLVPSFVAECSLEEVLARVRYAVRDCEPFRVRFAGPVAEQDWTRPRYHAVLLKLDDDNPGEHETLAQLRRKLLDALAPVRTPLRPELEEQEFVPHVTLALGVGEREANRLVNAIRADPLEAEFDVGSVWIVNVWTSDRPDPRIDRVEVRFPSTPPPVGLLSD
jgi:2'-5' RNA ligase